MSYRFNSHQASSEAEIQVVVLRSTLALSALASSLDKLYLPTALLNLPGVGQTNGVVNMAEKKSSAGTEDGSRRDPASSSTSAALDLWMLKWLQVHRQSLLDGLQNAVQIILDYLVEKGHMHLLRTNVYQEISLETTTSLDKARKLLDWLAHTAALDILGIPACPAPRALENRSDTSTCRER